MYLTGTKHEFLVYQSRNTYYVVWFSIAKLSNLTTRGAQKNIVLNVYSFIIDKRKNKSTILSDNNYYNKQLINGGNIGIAKHPGRRYNIYLIIWVSVTVGIRLTFLYICNNMVYIADIFIWNSTNHNQYSVVKIRYLTRYYQYTFAPVLSYNNIIHVFFSPCCKMYTRIHIIKWSS